MHDHNPAGMGSICTASCERANAKQRDALQAVAA